MNIGSGSHKYEVIDGWAKLPAGKAFGYTHGVVEDKQGRIFIHNASKDSVCIFKPDGQFVKSWGEEYAAGAHGMFLNEEKGTEYLYLATTKQNQVVKTTLDGKVVWSVGQPARQDIYDGEKKKFVPTESAVGPNGVLYVADGYGQPYVHMYSLDGEYKGAFGGPGSEKGQLKQPHGVKIDTRGKEPLVLVADRGNSRLQYFSLDGKHAKFGGVGIVLKPCTTQQHGDEIYIPDLHSRITILDKNDQLVAHVGEVEKGWEIEGWPNIKHELRKPGKFTSPHDLHVDKAGNIYLAEWISDGRVTKLKKQG